MIRRCQPLLGTFVRVTLDGASENALHKEAGKAFELIRSIQRLMSFHDTESDVSRLNRCAHVAPLRISSWTYQVIQHAMQLSLETEGAFDITIAPRLVDWGYLPRHNRFIASDEASDWSHIELLPDSQVSFHRPLQIDLGGIAKGFAVDKAIDYLSTRGIPQATVDAGGDLRVLGAPLHETVIRDPRAPQAVQHPTSMLRPAMATSATYFTRKSIGPRQVSPIVNPLTGKALRSSTSVSVFAATCMEADGLTKAVLLAPQKIWDRMLQARAACALFLTNKGEQLLYPV